jgi:hypothetical protein
MSAEVGATFRYAIDRDDSIVSVSPAWLEFARQNGAAELTREPVVGRPLWDFIAGSEVRFLYRLVLDRVRSNDPDIRRFMRLVISPIQAGGVQFDGVLVREERRQRVALLDPEAPRSADFVTICAWCKSVRIRDEEWVPAEEAIVHLDIFGTHRFPQLTHGICAACDEQIKQELPEGDEA